MDDLVYGSKGGSGGGGSSRAPQEAPNTLQSAATARVIDLIGEGPIVGLVDGLKSVYLNDTPLQNDNDSYNFAGVTVTERTGTPIQDHIPGFPSVEREVDVGAEVKQAIPIVRTVSNSDVDAVRIKIRVPALSSQNASNGDINGTSVALAIDVMPSGGSWSEVAQIVISGKTTTAYEAQQRVDLTGAAPWLVRVRRVTADSGSAALQNATVFTSYTEIIDAKLTYPNSALIGIQVDARQFGDEVPNRSYDVKGLIIRVPDNYNPVTRVYTGMWSGAFQLAWTDNPAWIYYDLATNKRYGAGMDGVDKWSLYQVGKYCDELVPDGYGGTEPRYTINTVIANQAEAIDALNQIASAFRGMTYWGSNSAVAVADMPSDPVKLVTAANVVDGDFEYEGSGLRSRHSVFAVTWNDPADNYRQQIEIVEDQDLIRKSGWRQADVVAFGCTSRGMAARLGRWMLYSERAETEVISYTAGSDHSDLRPGNIIAVSDQYVAGARLGGRISVTGTASLTIDKLPPEATGANWFLDVMLPTGSIERRTVTSFSGSTVFVDPPLSVAPIVGGMWMLSSTSVEPRLFRVLSVTESSGLTYRVSAVEYDPSKYGFIESGLALADRDVSLIPTGRLAAPTGFVVEEYLYKAGPVIKSGAYMSLTPPSDPRVSFFEYEVTRPGDAAFSRLGTHSSVMVDIPDTQPGGYVFRARSVSVAGGASAWVEITTALQGLLKPPTDISDLRVNVSNGQLSLWWTAIPDLDLDYYEVRYSPLLSGVNWSSAQIVIDRSLTNFATIPVRKGTYLVKAVDTSGGYSVNAISATSETAEINAYNAVEIVDENPAWIGVKVDTVKVGNNIQLGALEEMADWVNMSSLLSLSYGMLGVAPEGFYYADEVVDLGDVYTSRITSRVVAAGADILNVISSWLALSSVEVMDATKTSSWTVSVEISKSITPAPSAPAGWSDWEPMTMGEYTARAYKFRIRLNSVSPSTTPIVSEFGIVVDMPDRVSDGKDISCPAIGMRVNFSPAFMARPALAVDAQGLQTGDYKLLTSIDDEGFNVQFFNSAGTGIVRTFDYLAKGYGRRSV